MSWPGYVLRAKGACLLASMMVWIAGCVSAAAATYYVSPGGSDSNDGLSPGTAWQTVGKVNATTFQPGDQILFARGGEWRESLIASSSGAAGNPITFADYGSGAKPKFWGSLVLDSSRFYPVGGGVYAYDSATPLYAVLANHSFLQYSFGQYAGVVSNAWSFSGGQLFINSPQSDPRSNGVLYTAVVRDDVVYSNYQSHLVFRNLVTDESAIYNTNGGYGFRVMGSTDVQLTGCEAYRAGKHHFGVINSTQFVGRDLTAAYAAPGQGGAGSASAYVSYGDGSTGMLAQTSEWHNISAANLDDPEENAVYEAFLDHGSTLTSLWVDGLQSSGAGVLLSNADNTAATMKMTGGSIQNARLELDGDGLLVDGTLLTGAQASIDMTSSDTTLQNLVIYGTNMEGAWYQTALLSRGTGNTLRFSTIYMDPAAGRNTCVALTSATEGFNEYADALIAPHRVFAVWDLSPGSATLGQSAYNFYAPGTTFASFLGAPFQWTDMSLQQWQAFGFESGSKQGNPLFVDAAGGNLQPAAGSPLIDAAPLPASLAQAVPTDFVGNPRLQGAAFDIGAMETGSGGAGSGPITGPVTIPTSPPVSAGAVAILSPTDQQAVSGALQVTATMALTLDSAGSYAVVDGQPLFGTKVTGPPYVYAVDTSQLAPGAHTVQVYAHDIGNNSYLSNAVTFVVSGP